MSSPAGVQLPDPIGLARSGFNSGGSVGLIVVLLVICGICLLLIHSQTDGWSCCLVGLEGDLEKDHPWWSIYVNTYRGRDYYAGTHRENDTPEQLEKLKDIAKKCPVTAWSFAHFVFYILLAFIAPKLFWPIFLVSVAWELYEYAFLDCHDVLDIFWNFAGLLIGVYLRQLFFPVDLPPSIPNPRLLGAATPTSIGIPGRVTG